MHNTQDDSLDLKRLLDRLLAEHRLAPGDALRALEQAPSHPGHPLEILASLALSDRLRPGHTLDLDTLCQWLADSVGQPFLRLDPLQVDLAHVAGLISPPSPSATASLPWPWTRPVLRWPAHNPTNASGKPT